MCEAASIGTICVCAECRIEAAGGCQLDLMLVYEVFDSIQAMLLYPVNALRNLARMQACSVAG